MKLFPGEFRTRIGAKNASTDGSLKRLPWTRWKQPVLMRPRNYYKSFAQAA